MRFPGASPVPDGAPVSTKIPLAVHSSGSNGLDSSLHGVQGLSEGLASNNVAPESDISATLQQFVRDTANQVDTSILDLSHLVHGSGHSIANRDGDTVMGGENAHRKRSLSNLSEDSEL